MLFIIATNYTTATKKHPIGVELVWGSSTSPLSYKAAAWRMSDDHHTLPKVYKTKRGAEKLARQLQRFSAKPIVVKAIN